LNKLKTLLFLLGRPIFFLLLGRPTCSRRSPCSFSLSLAFFPTRAPLDPSRSRELRASAPGRYRASCPLRRVARLDPFLSLLPFFPWVPEHFPLFFRAAQRRAHPTITARVVAASLSAARTPPFPRYVAAGQTRPPLSFPRMGSRQPPPSSLAATPCLAASPVSCPRATSSFSWDIDTRAPQPRPRQLCPRPVRHLIPSMPEPVVPVELQVTGTAQRRASTQSRSAPGVVRSTGDGPLRLPIQAASTSATTSTPESSSPTNSMVFPTLVRSVTVECLYSTCAAEEHGGW
jgi:hypothetical protein